MADIKWIKLSTNMFEDEKIKLIESMPEADGILIIWIRLLAMAGKTNDTGMIYLTSEIPYTDEMLATLFNKPVNTVRLALTTLSKYQMIDIDEDQFIHIQNWNKHQNLEGMKQVKQLRAERNKRYYEKKKISQQSDENNSKTSYKTEQDALDIDKELDKEKNKYQTIFQHWNEKEIIKHRVLTQKTVSKIKARLNTFGVEELQQAIDHYHTVLTRPEYFWEYRWSLQEFLRSDENVEKFLNPAYLKGLRKKEFQHQVELPTARTSGFPPAKGIVESQVDVDDIYATLGGGG
ncbi:phage replisome organizer N-terminal domain-containing protein [Bacillus thuringiensis]|uniref:phage replisome organizer N-terminal domain-containing protein n=1 Tax=Bacillus thuringiensis TaxID=1428 RepID=UPI00080B8283|nr:phage replisome organizer N-terminal domain-containing protein [Bacillus thuringiensis]